MTALYHRPAAAAPHGLRIAAQILPSVLGIKPNLHELTRRAGGPSRYDATASRAARARAEARTGLMRQAESSATATLRDRNSGFM